MNTPKRQEILRILFEDVLNTPADYVKATSEHFIDDDDLLLDWSIGDLAIEQHEAIIDHMADCPLCRREVAKMVQAGALVLPEFDETKKPRRPAARRNCGPIIALLAVAAALLIAFIWRDYSGGGNDAARMLAMARQDLASGRSENAFERVTKLLESGDSLSDDEHGLAGQLLEESGYETARARLLDEDLPTVFRIETEVARRAGSSARLINLRIQAERGETKEHSLAGKTSLIRDYGYERDGRRGIKDFTFPQITPTTKRITEELQNAVVEHPDSFDLRLNLGQFLLEQSDFAGAAEQFSGAVRIDPSRVLAETGLGLALFRQNKPETIREALGHFRRAIELDPDNSEANQNLAVCLMRLGREEEAEEYFPKPR